MTFALDSAYRHGGVQDLLVLFSFLPLFTSLPPPFSSLFHLSLLSSLSHFLSPFFSPFFFFYFFHLFSSCAVLVPHYIRRGIFGHPVFMFAVSVLLYPALLPCLRLKVRLSRVA